MLTEEQLQQLSYALVPTFQQLEQDTINDIARRVKKTKRWTETAELQARTLKELGYSPAEIKAKVLATLNADAEYSALIEKNTLEYKQEVNKRIKSAIEEAKANGDDLISTAGNMSFSSDLAFWGTRAAELAKKSSLSSINNQFQRRLASELDSFSHSLGFRMGAGEYVQLSKAYNKATDRAITKVCSGAYSLGQAVQEAVNELEKSGIRKIAFASGVSRNIDTAVAMSTRTTLGQMAGAITMDNALMTEEDLVEVSSHAGARNEGEGPENHAVWQGKVYSISGRPHPEESARLGYAIRKLSTATGYPDNPAGLKGYNCRHSFYTFFEGISEPNPIEKDPQPVTIDGKEYDYYHATQKQRQLERDLRATKRQYVGGDKKKMAQIKMREQHYARFCEQAGLKQNLNGLYVKGYKRDFAYLEAKKVEYPPGSGKLISIKYNIGHKSNSRDSIPNSIVDHMLDDGYVDVRTHYDNYGRKDWEIHTTDHGNPKEHPYGKHGEHAHDYVWGSGGRLKSMKRRELTALERKIYGDII